MPDIVTQPVEHHSYTSYITRRALDCILLHAYIPGIGRKHSTGNRVRRRCEDLIYYIGSRSNKEVDGLTVKRLKCNLMDVHWVCINGGVDNIPLLNLVRQDDFCRWHTRRYKTPAVDSRHGTAILVGDFNQG